MSQFNHKKEWKSIPIEKIVPLNKSGSLNKTLILKTSVLLGITVAIISMIFMLEIRTGVSVRADGKSIAIVPSKESYYEIVEMIQSKYKEKYSKEINLDDKISLKYVLVPKSRLSSSQDVINAIQLCSGQFLQSSAIFIKDVPRVALKDESSARQVLNSIKDSCKDESSTIVGFFEDISIGNIFVLPEEILSLDDAVKVLTAKTNVETEYIVKNGDTPWDICMSKNIPIEELYKLNPNLKDTIYPGQVIKISVPENVLNVKSTKVVQIEEDVPFDVKMQNDDSLYKGDKKIIKKGTVGTKSLTIEIVQKNGIEVDRKILNEKTLSEPETEIVAIGSKAVDNKMFRMPVYGTITSRFGFRWGRYHEGIDIAGQIGSPIYAAKDGTVIFSGVESGYGNLIKIQHDGGYVTYYGHNKKNIAKVGDKVTRGDKVAELGNTGNTTGPHVHFEVRLNGSPMDPMKFIN